MDKIIVTGTTSGIGYYIAKHIVERGNHLIMINRNKEKADKLLDELAEIGSIDSYIADFSSFSSITKCIDEIKENHSSISMLVNNAGTFCDKSMKARNGAELTLMVNFLGQKYFTDELLSAFNMRVIFVSSKAGLFGRLKLKDGFFLNHASGFRAYSASKKAQIIYASSIASDIVLVHPGEVATGIWQGNSFMMKIARSIAKRFHQTPEEGAQSVIDMIEEDDYLKYRKYLYNNHKLVPIDKIISKSEFNKEFLIMASNAIHDL